MPKPENSRKAEWAKTFDPGVLAAGACKQFSQDSAELRPGIIARGFFNCLTVVNNSDAKIAIELDFNPDRSKIVPAHSAVPFTNMVPYQGINVVNKSTTTATAAGEVDITVRNERDVARERF